MDNKHMRVESWCRFSLSHDLLMKISVVRLFGVLCLDDIFAPPRRFNERLYRVILDTIIAPKIEG